MIRHTEGSNFIKQNRVPVVSGDPVDHPVGKWLSEQNTEFDTALMGIPFDGATVIPSRKGTSGGPAALRESLGEMNCYNVALDLDFSEIIKGCDLGDIPVYDNESVREIHERVSATLEGVIKSGIIPVSMGGDDSLCFAAARGLCRAADGQVGVIGFDAHLDMRIFYGDETSSGSSYRRILDELGGQVNPKNTVLIGINGWFAAKEYARYAREKGVTIITADEVYTRGVVEIIKEAIKKATEGTTAVYVNFDMDVLDQHYAPGKVMRNPGGMRGRDAYVAAKMLGEETKVNHFALNEVNTRRDVSGFTALIGASVINYFWSGLALRKQKGM
jgi:formiminoglutamase